MSLVVFLKIYCCSVLTYLFYHKCLFGAYCTIGIIFVFSHSVMSNSLWSHRLQHTRLPYTSLSLAVCSNSFPSSGWYHPTISSTSTLFSSCLSLSHFPASGSFPVSRLFASGGQSIGVLASESVLPVNIQGWVPIGLTGLISLLSKGLWRVFSSTINSLVLSFLHTLT